MTPQLAMSNIPVLIVDDSSFVRRTVREVLASNGVLNVSGAADGAEGLQRCWEMEPALILLDWTMPFLDGAEFLRLLRGDRATPGSDAAIVIITASPTPSLVAEARRWDIDAILRKPFSPGALIKRVELALAHREAARRPAFGTLQFCEI
jgi:CheY-like chemotaxis protein